jgi:hypothetical protein
MRRSEIELRRIKMEKQKTIGLLILMLFVSGSLACVTVGWPGVTGSGRVTEKVVEVGDFTGVELATFGNLTIETGDEEELRIEAEDNLIEYFEVAVYGDTLEIRTRPGVLLRPTRPVYFYLTVKELDTILLSGSGNVEAPDLEAERLSVKISGSGDIETGDLAAEGIDLRISGSGDLDIAGCEAEAQEVAISGSGDARVRNLDAGELEVRISGSGNLDVSEGEVKEQRVTISGSGDYDARHVASDITSVRINGSGSTVVQVRDHLEVRISGSGDVHYVGQPTVESSVSGSGDVTCIGG